MVTIFEIFINIQKQNLQYGLKISLRSNLNYRKKLGWGDAKFIFKSPGKM